MDFKKVLKSGKYLLVGGIAIATLVTMTGCKKADDNKKEYNKENEIIAQNIGQNESFNSENNVTATNKEISNQVQNNASINTTSTYDNLDGVYIATVDGSTAGEDARLQLCKNRSYAYYNVAGTDEHDEGYYTIENGKIILHGILRCSNDPGAAVYENTKIITMKLNSNGSISYDNLNQLFKKSNFTYDDVDIAKSIRTRLNSNFLYAGNQVQNNEVTGKDVTSTYDNLDGVYMVLGDGNSAGEDARIQLCKNGSYAYYNVAGTDEHEEGYYTVENGKIILHGILKCSNDPGATVYENTKIITMKLNSDGSISYDNLNQLFKKSNFTYDDVDIAKSVGTRLSSNFLY